MGRRVGYGRNVTFSLNEKPLQGLSRGGYCWTVLTTGSCSVSPGLSFPS